MQNKVQFRKVSKRCQSDLHYVRNVGNDYSPSLEGKYSEHVSPAIRGAPSFLGTSLFVGGDTREGLVKSNVARRAELSR